MRIQRLSLISAVFLFLLAAPAPTEVLAQTSNNRSIQGIVVTASNEAVPGATVIGSTGGAEVRTVTGDDGAFRLDLPGGDVRIRVEGRNLIPQERTVGADQTATNMRLEVSYVIPPIHQSVVITASSMQPGLYAINDEIYRRTLFARDDQLLETLNAGINAGQHEGGGKSLEIRRFGFNTDHGGVSGGLKVLVDNVQQNQGTQGHGQGYLGALKSVTPELVDSVDIVDGPFGAEYGDFSGLGVVHIRLKESLPNPGTVRIQRGAFGSFRGFAAYSPMLGEAAAFLSYEGSRTDGPFQNPLGYRRDNISGNYTRHLGPDQDLGLKINFGRNDFSSSGQIPLDLVAQGELDRFGAMDPSNGGRVRLGTAGIYYRKALESGGAFKMDGFLSRSLFDLYSNFRMFLNDPERGDGIQQHDSRYQEGFNTQFLHPHKIFGNQAVLTVGSNFHDNQINVGLFPSQNREPFGVTTRAFVHVTNAAGYVQQNVALFRSRVQLTGGLRWDYFRFNVDDQVDPSLSGTEGDAIFQPKFGLTYSPASGVPLTLAFNYGRGINTQDARGVVQNPAAPKIAMTDFYQWGASFRPRGAAVSASVFLIDRSNEQVYIPDDGSLELSGPTRSYGFESKTSIPLTRRLTLTGGVTQILEAYYRDTSPRIYVDSAPPTVANAALTFSGWRGFYSSLRWRHVGNYRLDGLDPNIRASGLDVVDIAVTKSLGPFADFNLQIDNVLDKDYYETQNYFESRVSPTAPAVERIHGTPGYPFGLTVGVTLRFGEK